MNLAPNIEEALDRFALEQNITRDEALVVIARDWLIGHGYLPASEEAAEEEDASGGAVVVGSG